MDTNSRMRPVHPGEMLREGIEAARVSEDELSKALDVSASRVTLVVDGRHGISANTALPLARCFGTSPELWLSLQQAWELRRADIEVGKRITRIRDSPSVGGLARAFLLGRATRCLCGMVSYSTASL